jgi:hypothetical protein
MLVYKKLASSHTFLDAFTGEWLVDGRVAGIVRLSGYYYSCNIEYSNNFITFSAIFSDQHRAACRLVDTIGARDTIHPHSYEASRS